MEPTMPDWKRYVREHLPHLAIEPEREVEIIDELAEHLEAAYQDALANGASEQEAYKLAATLFADWRLMECELSRAERPVAGTLVRQLDKAVEQAQSEKSQRRLISMGSLLQDLRYGLRILVKSPGFAIVAVLSLALGIGANTFLFSRIDAQLHGMVSVRDPEQVVLVRWTGETPFRSWYAYSGTGGMVAGRKWNGSMSIAAFERFRDQNQTLSSVFAIGQVSELNARVDGQAEMATGQAVSGTYFAGLGVPAVLGRVISNEDDKVESLPTAVISHRYWQRRFGGDPAIVGKTIYLNGLAFTIIGVARTETPVATNFSNRSDITVPMAMLSKVFPKEYNDPRGMRSARNWWLQIIGRLKPEVSAAAAQADLTAILQRHIQEKEIRIRSDAQLVAPQIILVSSKQEMTELRRDILKGFLIPTLILGSVLLIACINLANLLLARTVARQKEIVVRLSLGASRFRLIRQLLTESILLAGFGAALALPFVFWSQDALNWRVLGFTTAFSILTGILFGLAPALQATRVDLAPMLKVSEVGRGGSRSYLSKGLVVAQVAISLVLLIVAGLYVRTLRNLLQIDIGFNREDLLTFYVNPRKSGYEDARLANLYQRITESIAGAPGVQAVTTTTNPLLDGSSHAVGQFDTKVNTRLVGANFFATMGIPILTGRDLTTQDNQQASKVVVINQAMARRFFPNQNPIGRHIGDEMDVGIAGRKIVGVARDAKYDYLRNPIPPVVYLPYLQDRWGPPPEMCFVVRAVGAQGATVTAIRRALQSIDPNLPMFNIRTQNEVIGVFEGKRRAVIDASFFGLLALVLVSIGLYGVMSHNVARRTHEIGVRMALGAQRRDVLRMVLRESLRLTLIGILIGAASSLAAIRLIASDLYEVKPYDPLTLTLVTLLMIAVTTFASYLPARRASRVDPMVALRDE